MYVTHMCPGDINRVNEMVVVLFILYLTTHSISRLLSEF